MKTFSLDIKWKQKLFTNTFQADDEIHALKQAKKAYPKCKVLSFEEVDKETYTKGEWYVESLENDDTEEMTYNIMSDDPFGGLNEIIMDVSPDNAYRIVHCHNIHDELVGALESALNSLKEHTYFKEDPSIFNEFHAAQELTLKQAKDMLL